MLHKILILFLIVLLVCSFINFSHTMWCPQKTLKLLKVKNFIFYQEIIIKCLHKNYLKKFFKFAKNLKWLSRNRSNPSSAFKKTELSFSGLLSKILSVLKRNTSYFK